MYLGEMLSSVFSIVVIDLVLSGDNAAVIGLAIRNLPAKQRRNAALVGTGGAVVLRAILTVIATRLLTLRFLSAIGGALLIIITWKLVKNQEDEGKGGFRASSRFWGAVGTIMIADLSMAFDNVMGVAGAAGGNVFLVMFGLCLSVPILIAGSTWLSYLMGKYPIIIYIGAGVLVYTSLTMIFTDTSLEIGRFAGATTLNLVAWVSCLVVIIWGQWRISRHRRPL